MVAAVFADAVIGFPESLEGIFQFMCAGDFATLHGHVHTLLSQLGSKVRVVRAVFYRKPFFGCQCVERVQTSHEVILNFAT